jgi:hypothetical protein
VGTGWSTVGRDGVHWIQPPFSTARERRGYAFSAARTSRGSALCDTWCRSVRGSAWGCVPNLGRVARAWGIRVMGPLTHNVTATRPRFCIPLDEEPAITGRTADMSLPLWQSRVTHSECIPRVTHREDGRSHWNGPRAARPRSERAARPPAASAPLIQALQHSVGAAPHRACVLSGLSTSCSVGRVSWHTRRATSRPPNRRGAVCFLRTSASPRHGTPASAHEAHVPPKAVVTVARFTTRGRFPDSPQPRRSPRGPRRRT